MTTQRCSCRIFSLLSLGIYSGVWTEPVEPREGPSFEPELCLKIGPEMLYQTGVPSIILPFEANIFKHDCDKSLQQQCFGIAQSIAAEEKAQPSVC